MFIVFLPYYEFWLKKLANQAVELNLLQIPNFTMPAIFIGRVIEKLIISFKEKGTSKSIDFVMLVILLMISGFIIFFASNTDTLKSQYYCFLANILVWILLYVDDDIFDLPEVFEPGGRITSNGADSFKNKPTSKYKV